MGRWVGECGSRGREGGLVSVDGGGGRGFGECGGGGKGFGECGWGRGFGECG